MQWGVVVVRVLVRAGLDEYVSPGHPDPALEGTHATWGHGQRRHPTLLHHGMQRPQVVGGTGVMGCCWLCMQWRAGLVLVSVCAAGHCSSRKYILRSSGSLMPQSQGDLGNSDLEVTLT